MRLRKQIFVLLFGIISLNASAQILGTFFESLILDGFYYVLIETPADPNWRSTTFASYPYDLKGSGLFLPPNLKGDQSRVTLNWQIQSSAEEVLGVYGQVRYSPISLLSIDAYRLQFFDGERPEGTENLNLTALALTYNRWRRSKFHGWWGLGALWVDADENATTGSFNFGGTFYFLDPVSVYGESQIGLLDGDLFNITQFRLQLHLRRYLVYGGYHRININDQLINSWVIGGGVYF